MLVVSFVRYLSVDVNDMVSTGKDCRYKVCTYCKAAAAIEDGRTTVTREGKTAGRDCSGFCTMRQKKRFLTFAAISDMRYCLENVIAIWLMTVL